MAEKSQKNILMAPLLAGLAGAGIALLFAPRSGRDTRHSLQKKADDMRDNLEDNLRQAQQTLEHNISRAQQIRDNIMDKLRSGSVKDETQAFVDHVTSTDTRRHIAPRSSVLSTWEEEI
jgi:gas vesicle protein